MSTDVIIQFEIRDMLIMKDTLTEMGINYKELNNEIHFKMGYPVVISENTIKFDSDERSKIDKIKQTYQINFYKDQSLREGMQLTQETDAKGVVTLHITNK